MFRNYKYSGLTAYNTSGYFTTDSANTLAVNNINFNSNDWNTESSNITSYDAIISYLSDESTETITMSLSGSGFITTYTLNSLTKTTSESTTYYSAIVSGPTGDNTTLLNSSNYDIYFNLNVTRQLIECCEPNEPYLGTYTGNTNVGGGLIVYLTDGTVANSVVKGCGEVVEYSGIGITYDLGNVVMFDTCGSCEGPACNPVYQMSACSSPYEVFVLRYNDTPLSTGNTYGIVTESFNGCATVVEYSGTGLIYSASSLTVYANCSTCEGAVSPTPTPTPTVTPTPSPTVTPTNTVTPSITPSITPSPTVTPSSVFCNCISYTLTNTNDDEYVFIEFINCYGIPEGFTLGPQQVFNLCACENSIIKPTSVTIQDLGSCYGTTPTPTPTIPINPTPTPTPVISDCPNDYCLTINLPEYSNYNGNYTSYGTYNGREYYVGSVSGVVYYNGVSWCLSDSLIGDCILFGKTPCFSNCPDIDENLWTEGICPTPTPSPVIPCLDVSFEAIFDCETTPTPTPTPSITPTLTPTPSTYINPCATVDANITINEILTPTPTPTPTQSPTIQRNVNVSGVTTFTIIDTEFSCNFVRQITECVSNQVYYISQSMRTTGGTIVETGQTISANVSGNTYCYVYNGRVDNQSPTLTLNSIIDVHSNCEDCYTNVGGYLITESGDYLSTEDDDYLIY